MAIPSRFDQVFYYSPVLIDDIDHNSTSSLSTKEFDSLTQVLQGAKTQLFKSLVSCGILDSEGNLTSLYLSISLPPLNKEENEKLKSALEETFEIVIDGQYKLTTSIASLLRYIFSINSEYSTNAVHLVGSYVSYQILFQTNYVKRVFESLNIAHLYDETLLTSISPPSDIDLKVGIFERSSPQCYMDGKAFGNLKDKITYRLSYWFIESFRKNRMREPFHRKDAQQKIVEQAFKDLKTVDKGLNKFQLISFWKSPFDVVFYSSMSRGYVFTLDDLFIPMENLLFNIQPMGLAPCSMRGKPLESFFHALIGIIKAEAPETIDEKGYFRLFSLISKGNFPLQENLETMLFNHACNGLIYSKSCKAENFFVEAGKWLVKHYRENAVGGFAFLFNLTKSLSKSPLNAPVELWKNIDRSLLKSNLPNAIYSLLVDENVPFFVVDSFIQLCCFLTASRKGKCLDGLAINVVLRDFRPAIQLNLGSYFLLLDFAPQEHVEQLVAFFEKNPSFLNKASEGHFAVIFSCLCPPSENLDALEAYAFPGFSKSFHPLSIKAPHPFHSLFVSLYFSLTDVAQQTKVRVAERLLFTFSSKQKNSPLLLEFEKILGKTFPLLNQPEWEKDWLRFLFRKENSLDIAYEVWCEWFESKDEIHFSLELIYGLFPFSPHFAQRMFLQVYKEGKFEGKDLIQFISKLLQIYLNIGQPNHEHDQLIDTIGLKFLERLSSNEMFRETALSRNILWFAKWLHKRNDLKTAETFLKIGASKGFIAPQHEIKAKKVSLEVEFESLQSTTLSDRQIVDFFKKISTSTLGLAVFPKKTWKILLSLLKQAYKGDLSKHHPMFESFVSWVSEKKMLPELHAETAELFLALLEIFPNFGSSPLHKYKSHIETALTGFSNLDLTDETKRKLIYQCYLKKLAFNHVDFWMETLHDWCLEVESDKNSIEILDHLLLETELRAFRHFLTSDIKILLVSKMLQISSLDQTAVSHLKRIPPKNDELYFNLAIQFLSTDRFAVKLQFEFLNSILTKLPSARPLLVNAVFDLCHRQIRQGKSIPLARCLGETRFFDVTNNFIEEELIVIASDCFLAGLLDLEEKLIPESDTAEAVSSLVCFFKNLSKFLKKTPQDYFKVFFNFVLVHLPSQLSGCFDVLRKNVPQLTPQITSCIYSNVLLGLIKNDSQKLVGFIADYEKNYKDFAHTGFPEDILPAQTYLMEGAMLHLKGESLAKHLPTLQEIFFKGSEIYLLTQADNYEMQFKDPRIYTLFKSRLDFSYVILLFKSQIKERITEGKKILNSTCNGTQLSPEYWVHSLCLLNFLTASMDEQYAVQIDELIQFLHHVKMEKLNVAALLNYLCRFPTLGRMLEAGTIWSRAINSNCIEINSHYWEHAKRILDYLTDSTDEAATAATVRLLFTVSSHVDGLAKGRLENFQAELLYYNLKQWKKKVEASSYKLFLEQLQSALKILPNYYILENRLLPALTDAIATVQRFNENDYIRLMLPLWDSVIVRNKSNRKVKDKVQLEESLCIAFKKALLDSLSRLIHETQSAKLKNLEMLLLKKFSEEFPKAK